MALNHRIARSYRSSLETFNKDRRGGGRPSHLNRYRSSMEAQMCGRRQDARFRAGHRGDARSKHSDEGACCSVGVGHELSCSKAGQRQSMGWLQLGLAPSARSLEPVARWMGSALLRALLWLVGSRWRLG